MIRMVNKDLKKRVLSKPIKQLDLDETKTILELVKDSEIHQFRLGISIIYEIGIMGQLFII